MSIDHLVREFDIWEKWGCSKVKSMTSLNPKSQSDVS
jgi:hypothetical protein